MRTRRTDADGDWTFGRGRASYAGKSECVRQKVKTRLLSLKQDWFLDLEHGLGWLDNMARRGTRVKLESDIRSCILQTGGVKALTAFNTQYVTKIRKLTVAATFTDIYGTESEVTV
ncbi:hypothetical protein IFU23_14145 [Pantoea agglomerans]|uniref:hypothetical protein n=1 Tax=Enterobacter agglomerans TaxID=549 RepID=UPI00177D9719|nr:hypothetical protein [Pantoea agglomerans]MBD8159242.1 hypothetical protein [Pantoea agglomerans]MBD8230324.1 hypothetical protein [Pantoea agglomerans]